MKTKFTRWDDVKGDLSPDAQERVGAIKKEMRDEQIAYSLAEIRRSCQVTQTALASRLGTAQPNVSAIENSADNKLSTIEDLAAALAEELGVEGHVEVTMVIGDRPYPIEKPRRDT